MALGQAYMRLPSDAVGDPWRCAMTHRRGAGRVQRVGAARCLCQLKYGNGSTACLTSIWRSVLKPIGAQNHNLVALEAWKGVDY